MKRSSWLVFAVCLLPFVLCGDRPGRKSLKIAYPAKVVDCQGVCSLRPAARERWTPVETGFLVQKGDWVRTDPRGANAVQLRLANRDKVIAGPGSLLELVDANTLKLIRGEAEVTPAEKSALTVILPGERREKPRGTVVWRAADDTVETLEHEPNWLKYFKGTVTHESMGSLVANVEGRNLPLTLGYHKVTVDIRDQIARTVIEESFVNHTSGRLEGVFYFPLPQDASISGFGMWIGDELVEADVVEKQRAREIYETILRERRDPGLLEWTGGNIFKARVFPIFAHSEKRIKITYTQVLPMDGGQYRYSYALQSEMLKQRPLRELALNVRVHSALPIDKVACPTHNARVSKTAHSAQVEFSAEEYTPGSDFEVEIGVDQHENPVTLVPHRRGDDGYFLLLVNPADKGPAGRPLIGDGAPLDLIVAADTSASMDREQRKTQDRFIAHLLGSLGSKDRFRLACLDAECTWYAPEAGAQAATDETIGDVRDFLARRVSLGWTDLRKTLSEVLARAGERTQVIYVGDCIDTSGDADPVATANAIKRIYTDSDASATVHAVATGSSFEPVVLKALAACGGGSFRRLEGKSPARTGAVTLLEELTRPGMRNMQVRFDGMRAARVYPDVLPNLPAGRQQIVLGRYLPEGRDRKGKVVVSGELDGKSVSYEAPATLKDAESGNSFVPRLWARMHLDELLGQGRTPEIKADVIALSEEYNIMTPYTSFLVLESDEDRERFGVKRRFRVRDGQKFFAEGRDAATYELRRKQMRLAGEWRLDLRRRLLRELLGLGRQLPAVQPHGSGGRYVSGWLESGVLRPVGRDGAYPISGRFRELDSFSSTMDQSGAEGDRSDRRRLDMIEDLGFGDDAEGLDDYFESDEENLAMKEDALHEPMAEMESREVGKRTRKKQAYLRGAPSRSSSYYAGYSYRVGGQQFRQNAVASGGSWLRPGIGGGGAGVRWPQDPDWVTRWFPSVPGPPSIPRTPETSTWPAEAIELVESLVRQPALDKMNGGLELEAVYTSRDPRRDRRTGRRTFTALYSPRTWLTRHHRAGGDRSLSWYNGEKRGIANLVAKLGRQRSAHKTDSHLRLIGLSGYNDFSFSNLAVSYASYEARIEKRENDTRLLVLSYPANRGYELRLLIDAAKKVVIGYETHRDGKLQSRQAFAGFVQAAGCWWATRVEHLNADGKQTATVRLTVREVADDALNMRIAKEMGAVKDAILLNHPLPSLAEAGTAEMTLEDQLVHVSRFVGLGQHDRTAEQWAEARKLVADKPGTRWLDMEMLLLRRRQEEARGRITAVAEELLKAGATDDLCLANLLLGQLARCGQTNERLALLERLRPVYERQEEFLMGPKTWLGSRADLLDNAGRREEALEVREELTTAYPDDVYLHTRYLTALLSHGDVREARKRLAALLADRKRWTRRERNSIRSGVAGTLMNLVTAPDWLEFTEAWIAEDPTSSTPHQYHLTALFRANKTARAHATLEAWIRAGLDLEAKARAAAKETASRTEDELAVTIRMQAAVRSAIGQGYNMYNSIIDPRWYDLLAETAKVMFHSEYDRSMDNQIMQHHQFVSTDQARRLRQHFTTVLVKEAASLDPSRLSRLIAWVSRDDPKVDDEIWPEVASRLQARWEAETDAAVRHGLGQALVTVLYKSDREKGVPRFLRRQIKEGPEVHRQAYISRLYNELLSRPWTEELETEVFALWPRQNDAEVEPIGVRALVPALYHLVDAMLAKRQEALAASSEERGKMTRQELAAERKQVRAKAMEGLAARLIEELEHREEVLHRWLKMERVTLEMKLKKDPAAIAAECRRLMPREPWVPADAVLSDAKAADADELPALTVMDAHFYDRCLSTLCCLAARRSADAKLVESVTGYIDRALAVTQKAAPADDAVDRGAYWKYQKYRLLGARDEVKPLERTLTAWLDPKRPDPTWRRALGYLMAEQNRIEDALAHFEVLKETEMLGPRELRTMADWLMVLDRRKAHEAALVEALEWMQEHELSNRIHTYLRPWQRSDSSVPEELDPEVRRIFVALFRKARHPHNYLYRLADFYRHTRDFRLLTCLPEGMLGHSVQQVYPYIRHSYRVLKELRDEATVDDIAAHLETVRADAQTPVDRRALDLLEAQIRRRAAELINQPGPHESAALAAMKRAFKGDWQPGERRLMADLLASLGKIARPSLEAEQLRQLKELHGCETEPDEDRLFIARRYAETLWAYSRHEQAIDLLESALDAYRALRDGVLPATANTAADVYISYLEQRKRFARGETWLLEERKRPANRQQDYWLTRRLLDLYVRTITAKSSVSLGTGKTLYGAVYDMIVKELSLPDRNHGNAVVDIACRFFRESKRAGLAIDELRAFAFEVFPRFLGRQTDRNHYHNKIRNVAGTVHDLLGALIGLEFLVERLEQEPEWLRTQRYNSGWHRHASSLAHWRHEAKKVGEALETRLLNIVKRELRRDLVWVHHHYYGHRYIYHNNHSYFWKEKAHVFKQVAEEVWREHRGSGATVARVAEYLWDGLDEHSRAIEMLLDAYDRQILNDSAKSKLVDYLHKRGRYAESVRILNDLIESQPHAIHHRTRLMMAWFKTAKPDKLRATLATADEHFHAGGRWTENNMAALARACLNTQLYTESVKYYDELIPLRKRTHGRRRGGDGTLSEYYRYLGQAHLGLKQTVKAVDAACGAIVVWGRTQRNRSAAVGNLQRVLAGAHDLDDYAAHLDRQTAKTGLENPIVRKALGKVYLDKRNYKEAIRHLCLAVENQPNDGEAHKLLVQAYDRMNDKQGAIDRLLASVDLSRRDIDLYRDLGDRYKQVDNAAESERAYLSIAEMLPNESESHTMLAGIRQKQGRWQEAIHHWRQVVRVRALEPTGLIKLAEAQIHEKQWPAARETVKQLRSREWPARFGNVHHTASGLERRIPKSSRNRR